MTGEINLKALRAAKLGPKDMALHLAFMHEYMLTHLTHNRAEDQILTIMDASNISLTKIAHPDTLALIRAASEVRPLEADVKKGGVACRSLYTTPLATLTVRYRCRAGRGREGLPQSSALGHGRL